MGRFCTLLVVLLAAGLLAAETAAAGAVTISRVESTAAAGSAITGFSFAEVALEGTSTTADAYSVVITQANPRRAWSVEVASIVPLTHSVTGATIPAGQLYVENAPRTGAYNDLSVSRTVQSAIDKSVYASGDFHFRLAPLNSVESGTYRGSIRVRVVTTSGEVATQDLNVTASVTASIGILRIVDAADATVTSVTLPETPAGATSSPVGPYAVQLASTTGRWSVQAAVTTPFAKPSGETLPNSSIQVSGPAQSGSFVDLSSARLLQTGIPKTALRSGDVLLRLSPPAVQDSGSYVGVVTFTVSTL